MAVDNCFDIAVIGAGPAGCAAAITARRLGKTVVIVDRATATHCSVVERMAPATRQYLADWGLIGRIGAPMALECSSVVSAWSPDAPPQVTHAIFDPFGGGWIIERDAFDRMLRHEVLQRGATIIQGTVSAIHVHDADCSFAFDCAGSKRTIQAKQLVLAVGRGTSLIRALTVRSHSPEKWVAILGRSRQFDAQWEDDPYLFVEKTESGWMYGMPAPARGVFIGVCLPARLLTASPRRDPLEIWRQAVSCSMIRESRGSDADAQVWCRSMTGCAATEVIGQSWAVVGDTARTVDPLSGLGVAFALESGRRAVEEPGTYAQWIRSFSLQHDASKAALYDNDTR